MPAAPRIAVVGSCISRDPFNSAFFPEHKERATLVHSVFQSSLPSFVRSRPVEYELPEDITDAYQRTLRLEFAGKNMANLILSKPDILVMDFYADVHFGVTRLNGQYVTRNHMAFNSSLEADRYYGDKEKEYPDRARFEDITPGGDGYQELATNALLHLKDQMESESPSTMVIVNSARFALGYYSVSGTYEEFSNRDRLIQKNAYWQGLDDLAISLVADDTIRYPEELIRGSESHKWGLNPVHYAPPYYHFFWQEIDRKARAG